MVKNLLLQAVLFLLNFKAGALLISQMSPIRLLGKAVQPEWCNTQDVCRHRFNMTTLFLIYKHVTFYWHSFTHFWWWELLFPWQSNTNSLQQEEPTSQDFNEQNHLCVTQRSYSEIGQIEELKQGKTFLKYRKLTAKDMDLGGNGKCIFSVVYLLFWKESEFSCEFVSDPFKLFWCILVRLKLFLLPFIVLSR